MDILGEDLELTIAEKEIEISKKQSELQILTKEVDLLRLRLRRQERAPMPTIEEEERKPIFYAVIKGPLIGVHIDYQKVRNLHPSDFVVCHTKMEADMIVRNHLRKIADMAEGIKKIRTQQFRPETTNLLTKFPSWEEWLNVYLSAQQLIEDEGGIPVLRGKDLRVITFRGIHPGRARDLFVCGLLDTMYLSPSLEEISQFPRSIVYAVRNYVSKIKLEASKEAFLRFQSSLPDWQNGSLLPAYHYIKLGIKGRDYVNPERFYSQPEVINEEDLVDPRIRSFGRILIELEGIKPNSHTKVNMANDHIIITSRFTKQMTSDDAERIKSFINKLSDNNLLISDVTRAEMTKRTESGVKADAEMIDAANEEEEKSTGATTSIKEEDFPELSR